MPKKAAAAAKAPRSKSPARKPRSKSPVKRTRSPSPSSKKAAPKGKWLINTTYAETFWFSTEGNLMYPISKVLCPPLRFLGITPNQITLFNIFIGLGSGYCLVHKLWLYTWVLNFMHQLLDAMDGTMARMYGLQSEFGAKLDEFTDIFFGGVICCSALYVVWPDFLRVAVIIVTGLSLLAAELAWSSTGKKKKYVEELTALEFWGLWGIECQSINMWAILGFIVGIDHMREQGHTEPAWLMTEFPLTNIIAMETLVAFFLGICVMMLINHGLIVFNADRKTTRQTGRGLDSP